jgi:hypothetical protein
VRIRTLDLGFNELSGPVPAALAPAADLFLGHNRLSGAVPHEIVRGLLDGSLANLFLPHNLITGLVGLAPSAVLPDSASLCADFNCMETPAQSHCPPELYRGDPVDMARRCSSSD